METGGWMRVFCTSANTLRRRRLPIPSLARPIQRSVSSVIGGVALFCMCLKKPIDVPGPLNQGWSDCDEAPQRTPGRHHASKRVGWSGKNLQFAPFFLVPRPCFYFLSCRSPCWPISSGCRMMCWWSTGWTGSRITASTSGLLCSAPAQFHIWSMYFSIIWASQVPWSTLSRGTWQ